MTHQGSFQDAPHAHHFIIEEAKGRLRVPGVCKTCGAPGEWDAYWDEAAPGGFNKKKVKRSYATDPLSKMRVKW